MSTGECMVLWRSRVKCLRNLADETVMIGPGKKPSDPSQVRVTLDGQTLALSPQLRVSLPAIRAHLEALVLCQRRILHELVVDGVTLNLHRPAWAFESFQHVAATTISFEALMSQLLHLAREQVAQLRSRSEAAVLLVLINEWPAAQRIWWNLLPDLKEPLVTLSFLPELGHHPVPLGSVPTETCARQAEELGRIQQEVEGHCAQRDALALSDTLEQRLLPWLDQLGTATGTTE